ncbi:MAG: M20/M25/M40 family metallo-hydrolase, partial [Fimbriimonadales bacterium]|nr:M20/M25/M40 family metallo-hydrolase [Fimbriimonadales bacterium]
CSINSPPRQERAVLEYVKGFLRGLGLEVREDNAADIVHGDANNLVATLPANITGAPKIFFSAHFDTVEPNPNVQIIVQDGVIKTDGKSILGADDKAGMSAILEAIRIVVENNLPHGQIQLLLTVCEEIGLKGARALDLALVDSDFGFVYDTGPPVGTVITQTPNHDRLNVHLMGVPAHAGVEPEKGVSAIQIAAHAISQMKLGRIDPETTANIGIIHGGQATNIVCPEVFIEAEARSLDRAKLDAQVGHMIHLFEHAARLYGGEAVIEIERHYEGYTLTEQDLPVQVVRRALGRLGLDAPMRPTGGGSDANVFIARGLPCCVVGTAHQKIHTHEEFVLIDDLAKSVDLTLAIIREVVEMR